MSGDTSFPRQVEQYKLGQVQEKKQKQTKEEEEKKTQG